MSASQTQKEKADLIVTGGTVVTMDGSRTIYDDGAVAVKGDTIVAVGPRAELEANTPPRRPSTPKASWSCPDSSTATLTCP